MNLIRSSTRAPRLVVRVTLAGALAVALAAVRVDGGDVR